MKTVRPLTLILLATIALLSTGTLMLGPTPFGDVIDHAYAVLTGQGEGWNPLLHERIPRLIVILCSGASLGVAGCVMQSHFQNPLASPSVLGITSGGSLAVVMTFIFGWHQSFLFSVPIAAFIGAMTTLFFVYTLSREDGIVTNYRLILTGIAFSTVLISIHGTLLYAYRHNWHLIQTLSEWQAASTNDRSWNHVHFQLPLFLIGMVICCRYKQELNILALGDEEASNLGVDVPRVRWRLFLGISLLVGGSLASIGILPFLGLIIPHLFRRIVGPNNIVLIPTCAFGGAAFLLSFDFLLRSFEVHQLSLGNLSSILGGFFFLSLLITQNSRGVQWQS